MNKELKLVNKKLLFFPEDFDVKDIDLVKESYNKLLKMPLDTGEDIVRCLEKKSELSMLIGDHLAWLYIDMTCNSNDETKSEAYTTYYNAISSATEKIEFELKKAIYESKARYDLNGPSYTHLNKLLSNEINLFVEENILIRQQITEIENKYGNLYGSLTVNLDGEEKTFAQLNVYLKNNDRKIREQAWRLKMNKLNEHAEKFNEIFDAMKKLRIQEAKNAGFGNYRDYMHQYKGRFAYTPDDLKEFHIAVEKAVIPYLKEIDTHRKQTLNLDSLRPWDVSVDLDGRKLNPFENTDELILKSINVLDKVDVEFAEQLLKMQNSQYLDLDNRKGKAPGGYNYPIGRVNSSFIFMNAVGLHDDVTTLLHESGHAMHAKESAHINIDKFKETPSEVAELASMSMELLTMDYWKEFYPNPDDFKKAKREQLEGTLSFLPWCMTVDAFQHWIYTNPNHSVEERNTEFSKLMDRFNTIVDWVGLEKEKANRWILQLHIFEVPFYYIEYAMSQLGALAIYKNYKENPKEAIRNYKEFLKAGYTVPVDKLYEIAGVNFSFTEEYIQELVNFVKKELESC